MEAPIVTLTTDWGDKDYFVGRMKAALITLVPDVRIFDISHSQSVHDPATTREVILYACLQFPKGSIHIIDVGSDSGDKPSLPQYIALEYRGHILLCSSIELMRKTLDDDVSAPILLPIRRSAPSWTFLAFDIFSSAIQFLTSDLPISALGETLDNFQVYGKQQFLYDDRNNLLRVHVAHFDHYGNATLDIAFSDFEKLRNGRLFELSIDPNNNYPSNHNETTLNVCVHHYNEVLRGALLLTISHTGFLQIAINQGSIQRSYGLNYQTICEIRFFD